jgi:RNA chaperone Hfq
MSDERKTKPMPPKAAPKSIQEKYLLGCIKAKSTVAIRTLDGEVVTGTILGFDTYVIKVQVSSVAGPIEIIIYKHAIKSIDQSGMGEWQSR